MCETEHIHTELGDRKPKRKLSNCSSSVYLHYPVLIFFPSAHHLRCHSFIISLDRSFPPSSPSPAASLSQLWHHPLLPLSFRLLFLVSSVTPNAANSSLQKGKCAFFHSLLLDECVFILNHYFQSIPHHHLITCHLHYHLLLQTSQAYISLPYLSNHHPLLLPRYSPSFLSVGISPNYLNII